MPDLDEFFQTSGMTLHLFDWAVHWSRKSGEMIARRVAGDAYTDEAFYFQGSFVDVDSAMAVAKDWIERQQDRGVF